MGSKSREAINDRKWGWRSGREKVVANACRRLVNCGRLASARSGTSSTVGTIVARGGAQMLRMAAVRPKWARMEPAPTEPATNPIAVEPPREPEAGPHYAP